MENYLGYKLLFSTIKGNITGVLCGWDEINEQIIIENGGSKEILDILDINDLEILESKPFTKKQETANETGKESEISENEFMNKCALASTDIKSKKQIKNHDFAVKNNLSFNLQKCLISEQLYLKLINDCFNIYGPSKEDFINIVSLNLLKLFKIYKKNNLSICILMGKNSLFNCIGYHLARILSIRSFPVQCVDYGDMNIETMKYKYFFRNNSENVILGKYDICLCLNGKSSDVQASEYYYFNKISEKKSNSVCISLGCIIEGYRPPNKWYIMDMNIGQKAYEVYKLARIFEDSSIVKIQ